MADHLARGKNVPDIRSGLSQGASHQQAAVAVQGVGLGTESGDAMASRACDEPLDAGSKGRNGGHPLVISDTIGEQRAMLWAAAEFLSEKDVGDASLMKRLGQAGLVEMGREA